jgi:hypothetical protein
MQEISCEEFKKKDLKNYHLLKEDLSFKDPNELPDICDVKIFNNYNILDSIAEIFSYDKRYEFYIDDYNYINTHKPLSFYWLGPIIDHLINIYESKKESFNIEYNNFLNKLFSDFDLYNNEFVFLEGIDSNKMKEIKLDEILNENVNIINFKNGKEEKEISIKNIRKKFIYRQLFFSFFFDNPPVFLEIYDKIYDKIYGESEEESIKSQLSLDQKKIQFDYKKKELFYIDKNLNFKLINYIKKDNYIYYNKMNIQLKKILGF